MHELTVTLTLNLTTKILSLSTSWQLCNIWGLYTTFTWLWQMDEQPGISVDKDWIKVRSLQPWSLTFVHQRPTRPVPHWLQLDSCTKVKGIPSNHSSRSEYSTDGRIVNVYMSGKHCRQLSCLEMWNWKRDGQIYIDRYMRYVNI